jgi:hypothetical protein
MDVMGELVTELGRDLPYRGAAEFHDLLWRLLGSPDKQTAVERARADRTTPAHVLECLEKSVVVPGSLQPGNWAATLGAYRAIVTNYLSALSSYSFFDRALTDNAFTPELLGTKIAITTASAIGSVVSEGSVKPVSFMAFNAPTIPITKAIVPVIVTEDTTRFREAMGLIGRNLRSALVKAVDTYALSVVIAAATSTPTTGGTVANLVADMKQAFNGVTVGQESKLYWVLSPTLAVSLAARVAATTGSWDLGPSGGTLAKIPVVVSSGVPSGDLILVDASQFGAASEPITLDSITQGTVQLESSPDSPSTSSTLLISLWQQNMVGQVATRYFGIVALTATAAAVITGMS